MHEILVVIHQHSPSARCLSKEAIKGDRMVTMFVLCLISWSQCLTCVWSVGHKVWPAFDWMVTMFDPCLIGWPQCLTWLIGWSQCLTCVWSAAHNVWLVFDRMVTMLDQCLIGWSQCLTCSCSSSLSPTAREFTKESATWLPWQTWLFAGSREMDWILRRKTIYIPQHMTRTDKATLYIILKLSYLRIPYFVKYCIPSMKSRTRF